KLAREATAPDPDVRRCLAHFRLHVASMEWTSKDVRSQISSVEMEEEEEDDDDDNDEDEDEDANQKAKGLEERLSRGTVGAEVKKEEDSQKSDSSQPQPQQSSPTPDVLRVSFHVQQRPVSNDDEPVQQEQQPQQPPSPPRKDDGILERSRSCLEKTGQKKHFWLSSGQCVPVRIAS
ncbi:hypothetical protein PHISP_08173, partial [Aspergillus sp. HF37]